MPRTKIPGVPQRPLPLSSSFSSSSNGSDPPLSLPLHASSTVPDAPPVTVTTVVPISARPAPPPSTAAAAAPSSSRIRPLKLLAARPTRPIVSIILDAASNPTRATRSACPRPQTTSSPPLAIGPRVVPLQNRMHIGETAPFPAPAPAVGVPAPAPACHAPLPQPDAAAAQPGAPPHAAPPPTTAAAPLPLFSSDLAQTQYEQKFS